MCYKIMNNYLGVCNNNYVSKLSVKIQKKKLILEKAFYNIFMDINDKFIYISVLVIHFITKYRLFIT
jgi:hypothetical protein